MTHHLSIGLVLVILATASGCALPPAPSTPDSAARSLARLEQQQQDLGNRLSQLQASVVGLPPQGHPPKAGHPAEGGPSPPPWGGGLGGGARAERWASEGERCPTHKVSHAEQECLDSRFFP